MSISTRIINRGCNIKSLLFHNFKIITYLIDFKKVFNNEGYVRDVIIKTIDREVRREVCGESGWHTIHDMNSMIKDEILSTIVKEVKDKVIISLKGD